MIGVEFRRSFNLFSVNGGVHTLCSKCAWLDSWEDPSMLKTLEKRVDFQPCFFPGLPFFLKMHPKPPSLLINIILFAIVGGVNNQPLLS